MPRELRVGDVMTRGVETIEESATASLGALLARFRRFRHLPVVDEQGRLVGMLTRTDVLEEASVPGEAGLIRVADIMSSPAVSVTENETVQAAAQLMLGLRVHSLPVVDSRKALLGIVTDTDLLSAVAGERLQLPGLDTVPVDVIMTRDPETVDPDDTLEKVAGMLVESGVRHLPVVDEGRHLVGIVSERDVRTRLGTELRDFARAPQEALEDRVSSIMTPDPAVLQSGASLGDAVDALAEERVGALPVLDEAERLVGIVSYLDVLAWLRDQAARGRQAEERPAPH